MSARHGGRHSTIVTCRSATSTSTRTSPRTPSGTLPRHHRCTRATSVSGRTLTRLVCNPSRCDVHWNPPDHGGAKSLDETQQSRRNAKAARKFFRKLLKGLRYVPRVLVTDKLASYGPAHRVVMPSVEHRQSKYLNNRAENSARATVPVSVQRHLAAFPAPSTPAVGGRVPTGDGRPLRGLERDHRDDRRLKVNWDRSFHQNRRTTRER